MSIEDDKNGHGGYAEGVGKRDAARAAGPRPDDPRVRRTREAVLDAARTLFVRQGYAGTTMDEIAARSGRTKRTLYNHFADKESLFHEIVAEVLVYAEAFARALPEAFSPPVHRGDVEARLHALAQRLAHAIVRPEVVALRRLLIGESRTFPTLAKAYHARAPAQVMEALAVEFGKLHRLGVLRTPDPRRAAGQFSYLVAGEALDRAVLVGEVPPAEEVSAAAREGVETFLARYRAVPPGRDARG